MASTGKGKVIHRETFQNSNQLVEVLIRTKPKLPTSGTQACRKGQFKRDCLLKNQLDQIPEESSLDKISRKVSGSKLQQTQHASKKLNNDINVEVSKSKKQSRKNPSSLSHDRTWSDVFKSYSSIREEDSVIESTTSCDASRGDDTDHVPSKGPKTLMRRDGHSMSPKHSRLKENRSVQTSQVPRSFKESHRKAFQIDRPSFTDKETTVPLHMQVLCENFENVGQNQQVIQRMYQSQHGISANLPLGYQASNHQEQTGQPLHGPNCNAALNQGKVGVLRVDGSPANRKENSYVKLPSAEEVRLLSDGLSTTPFSDSALQLLQQLRQKLHLRGDSESSEMLGALEQFFVSGAPAGWRQQPLPSSPDPSLYNSVFNTPAAPTGNTNNEHQPSPFYQSSAQHHQSSHQLPNVPHQPNPEYGRNAAHVIQPQHQQQHLGLGTAYQTQYTQQSHDPRSGELLEVPPQYVEQLRRQLSDQAATITELRSLSSRLLAFHGQKMVNPTVQGLENLMGQRIVNQAVPTSQSQAVPTSQSQAVPTLENQAIPTSENQAIPTSENQAIPTSENQAVPISENQAVRAMKNQVLQTTRVPAPSAPSPTAIGSSLGARVTTQSSLPFPLHSAPSDNCVSHREDGSSRITISAANTQHLVYKNHPISSVQKENVNPDGTIANDRDKGPSQSRGVTFGSLPQQYTQQQRQTDASYTTAPSVRYSEYILDNKRVSRHACNLPSSHGDMESFHQSSHHPNQASPLHGSALQRDRLPDQLPSAGVVATDPPSGRGPPILLPADRGVPSASSTNDRMQRAALWSMHCENEMLKRQLREARQPAQSSHAMTSTDADAIPPPSSSAAWPQQHPLTSTRRSPLVSRPPDDLVGDSDSAFDERTSSKFGSKRPSPSDGDRPPHLTDMSSVPHAVTRSDGAAFRVTNTLSNAHGFGRTRSTFRSTAPQANVAATGVDTDMLRSTRDRQQTTLNQSVCNASTIPHTVMRDRQQQSPPASPPSSAVEPPASNSSSSETSVDRSMGDLTNPNYMNLCLSAVGQHVPSRLPDVEPPSEFFLSTISALSEDEQSLASNTGNRFLSNINSGKAKTSTPSERSVDSSRESTRPAAQFSASSSTISSCSMAQSIARQSQEGGAPLIVPRPLESTRLQLTQARGLARSSNRSSMRSSRDPLVTGVATGSRTAVPQIRDFEASSQFQTLTPEEDSSINTLT